MSSILRISGETLNIDLLLAESSLNAYRTWKRGESRTLKGKFHENSGACFLASDADFDDFSKQIQDATEFLEIHTPSILKMISFPGVQNADLDFGVSTYEGYFSHSSYFPPNFIKLAAKTGIGVEISHYLCSKLNED